MQISKILLAYPIEGSEGVSDALIVTVDFCRAELWVVLAANDVVEHGGGEQTEIPGRHFDELCPGNGCSRQVRTRDACVIAHVQTNVVFGLQKQDMNYILQQANYVMYIKKFFF